MQLRQAWSKISPASPATPFSGHIFPLIQSRITSAIYLCSLNGFVICFFEQEVQRDLCDFQQGQCCANIIILGNFGQPSSACCRKPLNKMGNGWKTAFLKVETSHLSSEGALTTTTIKLLSLLHRSSLPVTPNAEKELWLTGQWLTTKQACNIPGWDFPKHLKELGTEGPLKVLSPWPLRQSRKSHPKSWPIQFSQRNHDPGNGKTDSWWWWWCVQLY